MPGDTTLDQWDEHNTTAAPPNDDTTSSGLVFFLANHQVKLIQAIWEPVYNLYPATWLRFNTGTIWSLD